MKQKSARHIKSNGIHYTPPLLAKFLAEVMRPHLPDTAKQLRVLDPACGDGALLRAFVHAFPPRTRKRLSVTGYEMDKDAIEIAAQTLKGCGASNVVLKFSDFLTSDVAHFGKQRYFPFDDRKDPTRYDAIIANPPYVRTQILGAKTAQDLARKFRLTGRVDLYHAFTRAMANALKPGGVIGLLTSNRFLTTNAGESLRRMLCTDFQIRDVFDLGDTKLFSAAVLPAIVVASKRSQFADPCITSNFARAYEAPKSSAPSHSQPHILDAMIDDATDGLIETPQGTFLLERGKLATGNELGDKWSLSTPASDEWLETVRQHQLHSFEDIASIRVGLKTTADRIFVRSDWESLPSSQQPEETLLHPLITHHDAARWHVSWSQRRRRVLYPYERESTRRRPISLNDFPHAKSYLLYHEDALKKRKYVIDSGREWYEIWVPHVPSSWSKPKIVFPDISVDPKFFLDESGALVQGDCYWMTLREGICQDWLRIMLAVANSTFAAKYYDVAFHNKLYSGRRRFMTQYVKNFPVPRLDSKSRRHLIKLVGRLVNDRGDREKLELDCDNLIWEGFGLIKEV